MAGNTSTAGASVVGRALAVLDCFDPAHRDLSLSDISRRSGLALATCHRLVAELAVGRMLRRRDDGRYVIARHLWELGLLAPVQSGLREIASPFLSDIYGATRATVHLAVRDGHQVLYLDRLMGTASVPVVSNVGTTLPMHATGVGKVLLAHAPDEVQDAVLNRLHRVTPYTIVQPGKLRRQLASARAKGYATTVEEMTLGACSIAVPIHRPADGAVLAALGIVVPSLRRDQARLVTALNVAAAGISRSL